MQRFSFKVNISHKRPPGALIRKLRDDFELTVAPAALGRAQKSNIFGQDADALCKLKSISQLPVPLDEGLLISYLVICGFAGLTSCP